MIIQIRSMLVRFLFHLFLTYIILIVSLEVNLKEKYEKRKMRKYLNDILCTKVNIMLLKLMEIE